MVAPFSGAGKPVRPDKIDAAEEGIQTMRERTRISKKRRKKRRKRLMY